jgi:hypothetical protein
VSKEIVGGIKTKTNILGQVAAVMNLSGIPIVVFSSSNMRWGVGPQLHHAHWHHRIHRE